MKLHLMLGMSTAALMLTLTGCSGGDPPPDYQVLAPDADSLRAAFDADAGKVRALFLASPT